MPRKKSAPTHLQVLLDWWPTLSTPDFLPLPPPGTARQRPSEADAEATAALAAAGMPADTPVAYWLARDTRTIAYAGALMRPLSLHWRGDHARVRTALGTGPAGYTIIDGGPAAPFVLDLVTARDADGLPSPDDRTGVRQLLAELHSKTALTDAERAWCRERLRDPSDPDGVSPFITVLDDHGAFTHADLDRLLATWRARSGMISPYGWQNVIRALLRADHPEAWNLVEEHRTSVAATLATVPSTRALDTVRGMVLDDGDLNAVKAWLRLRVALHEPDPVEAAAVIAAELDGRDDATRALVEATRLATITAPGPGESYEGPSRDAILRLALDERLPRRVRSHAAQLTREWLERSPSSEAPALFEEVAAGLLGDTGPDLTAYEGDLGDIWHRYRTLAPADIAWLRRRVADPSTARQGLAVCLELLHAHGEATHADIDALVPRWKSELAKTYRTTYTEWRHPMVTLTCAARDLGHPLTADLDKWWARPAPKWKDPLHPLTLLSTPTEYAATLLWNHVTSGAHDTGHLLTWVLLRARLDGVPPRHIAAGLIGRPGVRAHVLKRVLLACADPTQPLWHYDVDQRSWSWWRRAVEIADDTGLPAPARALARATAKEHYLLRNPALVRPAPTAAEIVAAAEWAKG